MRAEFNTGSTPYILLLTLEGFVVASVMEDFCFNIRRLTFSAIALPLRRCRRGREEKFRLLLIWVVLVDTHPYPAVWRCPDAKTDLDGKVLFNVVQAVHTLSGSKDRFLL